MTDEEALSLPRGTPVQMKLRSGTIRQGIYCGYIRTMLGSLRMLVEYPQEIELLHMPGQIEVAPFTEIDPYLQTR